MAERENRNVRDPGLSLERRLHAEGEQLRDAAGGELADRIKRAVREASADSAPSPGWRIGPTAWAVAAGLLLVLALAIWWAWPRTTRHAPEVADATPNPQALTLLTAPRALRPAALLNRTMDANDSVGYGRVQAELTGLARGAREAGIYLTTFIPTPPPAAPASQPGL
ncbi:MAG: hypothetical protein BIFFINMI_01159 [Phycisphaerae bacterium]|nr:hypothetical protein [Phycisphaerae bacterium]